mmetsp:Transcript_18681/g.60851  ORF Transcript_18681/g.60851 Transcript_18681/m.60851 type:complete len:265 (+) Transcript_18681:294-1088(+)
MAACHLDAPRELSRNLRSQVDDNAEFFGERGSLLHTGLDEVIDEFDKGPFQEESIVINGAIREYVVTVFDEIQKDSTNHCLLMDGRKQEIKDLLDKVRCRSSELGSEPLNPDRLPLEDRRTILVNKVWSLHEERTRLVAVPSRVPDLLHARLGQFKEVNDTHVRELRDRQSLHRREALSCQSSCTQQEQYLQRKLRECHSLVEASGSRERSMETELERTISEVCDKLRTALQLAEKIRIERVGAESSMMERDATQASMQGHIRM